MFRLPIAIGALMVNTFIIGLCLEGNEAVEEHADSFHPV